MLNSISPNRRVNATCWAGVIDCSRKKMTPYSSYARSIAAKMASSMGRESSTPTIPGASTAAVGTTFMGAILSSLDLDARLPYVATVPRSRRGREDIDHGATGREGGCGDRRSLGDRRGHRAAVRDGGGESGLRRS